MNKSTAAYIKGYGSKIWGKFIVKFDQLLHSAPNFCGLGIIYKCSHVSRGEGVVTFVTLCIKV